MFLTDEYPERLESSDTAWKGSYRDRLVDAHLSAPGTWRVWIARKGQRVVRRAGDILIVSGYDSLIQSLQLLKCRVDWDVFREEWPRKWIIDQARRLAEKARATSPPDLTDTEATNATARLMAAEGASQVRAWWNQLTATEQIRFVSHVWECQRIEFQRPTVAAIWDEIVPEERLIRSELDPETVATWQELAKAWTKRPEPEPEPFQPRRQEPEQLPERRFGVCRKCHVCLAYDVAQGCCTVCGGRLVRANPEVVACGLCFPWAWREVFDNGGILVHGWVTSPTGDPPYAYPHAWVERDGMVYDWQTMVQGLSNLGPVHDYEEYAYEGWPEDDFYAAFSPRETREYTDEQAMAMLPRKGHHGPWHGPGSEAKVPEWFARELEEAEENPRGQRKRRRDGRLTRGENARLFRKLMRL